MRGRAEELGGPGLVGVLRCTGSWEFEGAQRSLHNLGAWLWLITFPFLLG